VFLARAAKRIAAVGGYTGTMIETRMITAVVEDGAAAEGTGPEPVPWWSFTKTVLAAAALALVADGRFRLDAPVRARPFTLRQFLQHRAGLIEDATGQDLGAALDRLVLGPLGLMVSIGDTGVTYVGHTGGGPGSTAAVYQCGREPRRTAAAFAPVEDPAAVERCAMELAQG
jgi:CubicO group peptidase (beta-lactamase class C family)